MSIALPLKDAYPFGIGQGLQSETEAVCNMNIGHERQSSVRRGYIIELFQKHGVFELFKQQFWPEGNTKQGKTKTNYYLRLKSDWEGQLGNNALAMITSCASEEEIEDYWEFAAETDLRDFLAKNLEVVEPGLRLYEDEDQSGIEFSIDNGRIDILAIDRNDSLVVFELKVSRGRNKALGQLLYYMGWVDNNLSSNPCRGIIVAKEIADDLITATQIAPRVSLFRYNMSFSIQPVSP